MLIGPDFDSLKADLEAQIGAQTETVLVDLERPEQPVIDRHAEAIGAALGLDWQPGQAMGYSLVVPMPDGSTIEMCRNRMYGFATVEQSLDVVAEIVERIVAQYGPGRIWSLAGRVNILTENGNAVVQRSGGEDYLRFAAWFCHESTAKPGKRWRTEVNYG